MSAPQLDFKFERQNSKYNRIWEQLTNIGIFIFTVIAGYIISLLAVEKGVKSVVTITQVNYTLFAMTVLLALACGILITHLIFARNEIKEMMLENKT